LLHLLGVVLGRFSGLKFKRRKRADGDQQYGNDGPFIFYVFHDEAPGGLLNAF
jgi:hypothetical protein